MRVGSLWTIALTLLLVCMGGPGSATAAERRIERGSPPVDTAASRKVGVAREFIAARQWAGAIDLIGELSGVDADRLVRLDPDRAVPGRLAARVLLGTLPPEGLAVYRRRIDPIATTRFEAAAPAWDEPALAAIVEEQFGSSVTDAALWQLGEIAFERGDLAQARGYWRLLVPLDSRRLALPAPPAKEDRDQQNAAPPAPDGQAEPPVVEAPDGPEKPAESGPQFVLAPSTRYPIADVRARLILCTIHLGEWSQARRELRAFGELHADAEGRLGDRRGRWTEILTEEFDTALAAERSALKQPAAPPANAPNAIEKIISPQSFATFAGASNRTGAGPSVPDFGAVVWSSPWSRAWSHDAGEGPFSVSGIPLSPWHVTVVEGCVFACDEKAIYGWKLATGEPIWAPAKSPVLFSLVGDGQGVTTQAYAIVGSPSFTVTIANGRLFARLGAITMGRPTQPVPASSIVCLNIGEGQGKVEWVVESRDLKAEPGDWVFEGSPAAVGELLVTGVRLVGAKPRAGVVALSATTGQQVWFREVATAGPSWQADEGARLIEVSHELLSVSHDVVYYNTHLGVVAALDLATGDWRWAWSYPRIVAATPGEHNGRRRFGPSPPVISNGRVFLAPCDSTDLFCLDAEAGMPLWRFPAGNRFRTVLGADGDRVYVSGRDVAAINADTGRLRWQHRAADEGDELAFARGCLAGDDLVWPTRDELRVFRGDTGELKRVLRLRDKGIPEGGNIVIADNIALIAGPKQLYALRQEPVLNEQPARVTDLAPPRPRPVSSRLSPRSSPPVTLASMTQPATSASDTSPELTVAPTAERPGPTILRQTWSIERAEDIRVRLLASPRTTPTGPPSTEQALVVIGSDLARVDPLTGKTLWRQAFVGRVDDIVAADNTWLVHTRRESVRIDPETGTALNRALPTPVLQANTAAVPPTSDSGLRVRLWPSSRSSARLEEWRFPTRLREQLPSANAAPKEWTIPAGEQIISVTWLGPHTWGAITAEQDAWLLTPDSSEPLAYTGPLSITLGPPAWIGGTVNSPGDSTGDTTGDNPIAIIRSNGATLAGVHIPSGKPLWSLSIAPSHTAAPDQLLFIDGLPTRTLTDTPASRPAPADAVILAVHHGLLSGWRVSTGEPLFRRPLGPADSDWRFVPRDSSFANNPVAVIQRRNGDLAQFWRIDAVTGRPLQWIEQPYTPTRLEWIDHPQGAFLVGPRHITGYLYE